MFIEVVNNTFIFLWQDNNVVIDCMTIYHLKNNTILRLRKRSFFMLINVRIVRLIFNNMHSKWLYIPYVIDDYNHYINDVDRSN